MSAKILLSFKGKKKSKEPQKPKDDKKPHLMIVIGIPKGKK